MPSTRWMGGGMRQLEVVGHASDGRERADERGVEVRIRDNGAGIEPAHLPRLFEPFFTTKPIGQGTGLGLSIAYGAVKAHGGTITVDSELGAGTLVTVWLPRGQQPIEAVPPADADTRFTAQGR